MRTAAEVLEIARQALSRQRVALPPSTDDNSEEYLQSEGRKDSIESGSGYDGTRKGTFSSNSSAGMNTDTTFSPTMHKPRQREEFDGDIEEDDRSDGDSETDKDNVGLELIKLDMEEVPLNLIDMIHDHVAKLSLKGNHLTSLPVQFMSMDRLTYLDVAHNQFTTFPYVLCECRELEILDISNNFLTTLPDDFGPLASTLKVLSLSNNSFEYLPPSLATIEDLRFLELDSNPLILPPQEFVDEHAASDEWTDLLKEYLVSNKNLILEAQAQPVKSQHAFPTGEGHSSKDEGKYQHEARGHHSKNTSQYIAQVSGSGMTNSDTANGSPQQRYGAERENGEPEQNKQQNLALSQGSPNKTTTAEPSQMRSDLSLHERIRSSPEGSYLSSRAAKRMGFVVKKRNAPMKQPPSPHSPQQMIPDVSSPPPVPQAQPQTQAQTHKHGMSTTPSPPTLNGNNIPPLPNHSPPPPPVGAPGLSNSSSSAGGSSSLKAHSRIHSRHDSQEIPSGLLSDPPVTANVTPAIAPSPSQHVTDAESPDQHHRNESPNAHRHHGNHRHSFSQTHNANVNVSTPAQGGRIRAHSSAAMNTPPVLQPQPTETQMPQSNNSLQPLTESNTSPPGAPLPSVVHDDSPASSSSSLQHFQSQLSSSIGSAENVASTSLLGTIDTSLRSSPRDDEGHMNFPSVGGVATGPSSTNPPHSGLPATPTAPPTGPAIAPSTPSRSRRGTLTSGSSGMPAPPNLIIPSSSSSAAVLEPTAGAYFRRLSTLPEERSDLEDGVRSDLTFAGIVPSAAPGMTSLRHLGQRKPSVSGQHYAGATSGPSNNLSSPHPRILTTTPGGAAGATVGSSLGGGNGTLASISQMGQQPMNSLTYRGSGKQHCLDCARKILFAAHEFHEIVRRCSGFCTDKVVTARLNGLLVASRSVLPDLVTALENTEKVEPSTNNNEINDNSNETRSFSKSTTITNTSEEDLKKLGKDGSKPSEKHLVATVARCVVAMRDLSEFFKDNLTVLAMCIDIKFLRTMTLVTYSSLSEVNNAWNDLTFVLQAAGVIDPIQAGRSESLGTNSHHNTSNSSVLGLGVSTSDTSFAKSTTDGGNSNSASGSTSFDTAGAADDTDLDEFISADEQLYDRIYHAVNAARIVLDQLTKTISKSAHASTEVDANAASNAKQSGTASAPTATPGEITPVVATKVKEMANTCVPCVDITQRLKHRMDQLRETGIVDRREFWDDTNAFLKAVINLLGSTKQAMTDLPVLGDVRPSLATLIKLVKEIPFLLETSSYRFEPHGQPGHNTGGIIDGAGASGHNILSASTSSNGGDRDFQFGSHFNLDLSNLNSVSGSGVTSAPQSGMVSATAAPVPATPLTAVLGPAAQAVMSPSYNATNYFSSFA